MRRSLPSRRALRIFLAGVIGSLMIVGAFFALAISPFASSAAGNWMGRALIRVFLCANPLLAFIGWLGMRLWGPVIPPGHRQTLASVIYVVVFVGWWWGVAIAVDRLARRKTEMTE
jgi:hypothetical protein